MSSEPTLDTTVFDRVEDHETIANTLEEPVNSDLSIAAVLYCKDPLVVQIDNSLKRLLVNADMMISAGLEMKHTLLLLVKLFHDLLDKLESRKQEWISSIQVTVGESGQDAETIRERTGRVIVGYLEDAPWGLQKQPGASRRDTAHSILAIHAGMVRFLRKLATALEEKVAEGVDLKHWDVEEMASDDEDEEDNIAVDSALETETGGTKKTKQKRTRQKGFQQPPSWTRQETLSLFRLYRSNAADSQEEITNKHNAACWGGSKVRSYAATRQELKKHMGPGKREDIQPRLGAKIGELERK